MGSRNLKEYNLWQGNNMTEAALRTPLCIYMTTETLLRPMLHRLSPNEGKTHFFALLPHQLTKYSNTMAMVSMAGHVFVAIWHAVRQAMGLANTDLQCIYVISAHHKVKTVGAHQKIRPDSS